MILDIRIRNDLILTRQNANLETWKDLNTVRWWGADNLRVILLYAVS